MAAKRVAHANPTKSFFVRMITRDISLEDCILDLIDNSIDGAWEVEGGHPIDLFCGCGGLSLGAHHAGLNTSVGIDVDKTLSAAFALNFPRSELLNADLLDLCPNELKARLGQATPTAVIGGPPCQGFSVMGKRDRRDPRNALLGRFFDYVDVFQPDFFLMENVPGLYDKANRGVLELAIGTVSAEYRILEPMVLNAMDFGAATNRPRLIVVGYKPEFFEHFDVADFEKAKTKSVTTVKDAIYDLPGPSGQSNQDCWMTYKRRKNLSSYAKGMRKGPYGGLASREARSMIRQGRLNGFQTTKHTQVVEDRFDSLEPGQRDEISKYPRLSWDKPAHVLRAGTGTEKGSFQAARPVHPTDPRVITVREAARIQGFPDWFQFDSTKWHSHRMIGNSVSPLFAKAILKVIMSKHLP